MMDRSYSRQSGGSAAEFLVVAVVAAIAAVFAIFAFPSLLSSGKAGDSAAPPATAAVERANEAAAIGSLRAIASAESAYASTNGEFGTLDELSSGGTIDSRWTGKPTISGYRFELTVDPAASRSFCASAMLVSGQGGGYSYTVSNRGAIYRLAGAEPPDCDAATGDITSGTILGE